MSNVIRMNFDQMNDIIAAQEKCENNIVETARDFDKSFKKHTNAGALVNSVRVEKQGLATIASAISGMNRVIRNHTENMKNFDEAVARKADEIEIPQDFLNENATKINTYNQSILAKIDGRSVNEGVTATAFNEIDESAIAAEGLLDITKQATQQQRHTCIGKRLKHSHPYTEVDMVLMVGGQTQKMETKQERTMKLLKTWTCTRIGLKTNML